MREEKRADTKRHFSDRREESLRWGGGGATERPGDLSAASAWVASNNKLSAVRPRIRVISATFPRTFFFSTRGGSGDGGKEVLCRVGKL